MPVRLLRNILSNIITLDIIKIHAVYEGKTGAIIKGRI
jgi:hypothetical protein